MGKKVFALQPLGDFFNIYNLHEEYPERLI